MMNCPQRGHGHPPWFLMYYNCTITQPCVVVFMCEIELNMFHKVNRFCVTPILKFEVPVNLRVGMVGADYSCRNFRIRGIYMSFTTGR